MSKKVLVLSGSPRPRGNTYKIWRLLEERLRARGDVSVRYVALGKLNLEPCRGCLACMRKGEAHCPCKDDALALRDELLAADAVVFLSPVYVHTVTGLMKTFYDRFAYLCHQPRFRSKATLLLTTTELTGTRETLAQMRFVAFTWGFRIADELGIAYPYFVKEGAYRERTLDALERAAGRLWEALTTPRPRPSIKEVAFYYLLRTKILLHKDHLPHDYAVWQERGWLEHPYFEPGTLGPVRHALGRTLAQLRVGHLRRELGLDLPPAHAPELAAAPGPQP